MRKEVQEFISADEERKRFIRQRPVWYRRLARKPDDLNSFQLDMMNFYEKTIPHRVSLKRDSDGADDDADGSRHAFAGLKGILTPAFSNWLVSW